MTEPALEARGCRWVAVPGVVDARGRINFVQLGKDLDFEPQRMFWLHHAEPSRRTGWRAHRATRLVVLAGHGACRVHLDDGTVRQTVTLDDPAKVLYIGPGVWHELTDFAPRSAIIVLASGPLDEAAGATA